jgi:hypothetical protein
MTRLEDTPVGWVSAILLPWLDRRDRNLADLEGWLRESGLPPVGHADEPYLWLLRALPLGADRPRYESEMARSAADLIDSIASRQRGAEVTDRQLYNLLLLSAGLRGRETLGESLLRFLASGMVAGREYNGSPLGDALCSALIANQPDNRLESVWRSMCEGQPHPVLGGTRHDGFEGIVHMPPSAAERGKPDLAAISFALTRMASHLATDAAARVPRFRLLLKEVGQRYPAHDWPMEFIRFSDANGWEDWTDVALPDLYVQLADDRFVLWGPVVEVCPPSRRRIRHSFCKGRIAEVETAGEVEPLIQLVAPTVEKYRTSSSYGGGAAMLGILSSALTEAALLANRLHAKELATSINQAHVRLVGRIITLRVRDKSGKPIRGAEILVQASPPEGIDLPRGLHKRCRARTDNVGEATIPGLSLGKVTLRVRARNYREYRSVISEPSRVAVTIRLHAA